MQLSTDQTNWKQIKIKNNRNSKKKDFPNKQLSYINVSTREHIKSDEHTNNSSTKFNVRPKLAIRNKVTKSSNCSYDTWEFFYFKYIVDLYEIFLNGINQLDTGIDVNSVDTFDKFSKFIRKCSSGEISPYLETIENTGLESLYNEFTIKRNKL
jgi:hypothetical protein